MAKNKIYLNHTLIEYSKKYGNKNYKKVNKVDADKNPTLLKDKSWWLIKDTYYEVPNKKGIGNWWSNLGKGGKIAVCALAGVAVATAVVVPTVIAINNNSVVGYINAQKDGDGADLIKDVRFNKYKDGTYKAKLELNEGKSIDEIDSIKITVGNRVLEIDVDYTLNKDTGEIVIKSGVIGEDDNEIIIKVVKKGGEVIYVTDVTCDSTKKVKINDVIKFSDLNVVITPSYATNKSYRIEKGGQNSGECLEIDNDKKEIKAIKAGTEQIWVIPDGVDPEGEEMIVATCDITVEDEIKTAILDGSKFSYKNIRVGAFNPSKISENTTSFSFDYFNPDDSVTLNLALYDSNDVMVCDLGKKMFGGGEGGTLSDISITGIDWSKLDDNCTLYLKEMNKIATLDGTKFDYTGITIDSFTPGCITKITDKVVVNYSNEGGRVELNLALYDSNDNMVLDIGKRTFVADEGGEFEIITTSIDWTKLGYSDTLYLKEKTKVATLDVTKFDYSGITITDIYPTTITKDTKTIKSIIYENKGARVQLDIALYDSNDNMVLNIGKKTFDNESGNFQNISISGIDWTKLGYSDTLYLKVKEEKSINLSNGISIEGIANITIPTTEISESYSDIEITYDNEGEEKTVPLALYKDDEYVTDVGDVTFTSGEEEQTSTIEFTNWDDVEDGNTYRIRVYEEVEEKTITLNWDEFSLTDVQLDNVTDEIATDNPGVDIEYTNSGTEQTVTLALYKNDSYVCDLHSFTFKSGEEQYDNFDFENWDDVENGGRYFVMVKEETTTEINLTYSSGGNVYVADSVTLKPDTTYTFKITIVKEDEEVKKTATLTIGDELIMEDCFDKDSAIATIDGTEYTDDLMFEEGSIVINNTACQSEEVGSVVTFVMTTKADFEETTTGFTSDTL